MALFGTALLAAGESRAQTCTVSYTALAFGSIDVLPGTQVDSAGTMSASCTGYTNTTQRTALCFTLDNGTYPLAGGRRQMGSGANRLRFDIYRNAARSTVWNATNAGTPRLILRRSAPNGSLTAYGRVTAGQASVPPGAYSTTITATTRGQNYTGTAPTCATMIPTFTLTTTFNVAATVISACSASATNLTFPNISSTAANTDATSTVTVTCTNSTPYHVRLDGGNAGATNPALRKMTSGAHQITYGLYRDAARTLGWGNTDGVNTLDATGTSSAVNHTVYGRIPPQAWPAPGTYTDTIVVTVSFL